jgi:putative cell wall-binding protein
VAPLALASTANAASPNGGVPSAHNGVLVFSGTSVAAGGTTPSGTGWTEVNPDGSNAGGRHEITPSGGGIDPTSADTDVAFSRDGATVAFIQHSDGTLWAANPDGSGARRLAVPAAGYALEGPSWSPDGSTVYFSQITISAGVSFTRSILRVPAAGGAAQPVLAQPDADGDMQAVVSPDGTKIAYTSFAANGGPSVTVADATTHAKLSTIPNANSPRFSPDGGTLAVTADNGITLYPPDGLAQPGSKGQTILTDLAAGGGYSFSPDATELAYEAADGYVHIRTLWNGASLKTGIANQVVGQSLSWQNGPLYTGRVSALGYQRPAAIRYGGADRVDTSVITAEAAYGDPASGLHAKVAVISRSDNYADALAGNALAAQKGGPLLLTGSAKLDARVAGELTKTLAPHSTVYLLGGPQALSPRVEADIAALGFTPKRLAGADRFGTAVRIAGEVSAHPSAILVATGTNFPDALAAGAAAAANKGQVDGWSGVVVLTDGAAMPAATKAYLSGFSPSATMIFGVGGAAVKAADTMPGYSGAITPLAGNDRYETAADVANSTILFGGTTVQQTGFKFAGVATGADWPDALSGGALVGALHAPLLLANGTSIPGEELVRLHFESSLLALEVFGGTKVVSDGVEDEAGDVAWGVGKWDPLVAE